LFQVAATCDRAGHRPATGDDFEVVELHLQRNGPAPRPATPSVSSGVFYRPKTELQKPLCRASLPRQFDGFVVRRNACRELVGAGASSR
jgi:hypothetical protein